MKNLIRSRREPVAAEVTRRSRPIAHRDSGFTMVEIALCLAIIGFALIAVIGVLPTGLNVQKDNREETIIGQDAGVWMNALRGGAQGYADLADYVVAITNYVYGYTWDAGTHSYTPDSQVGLSGGPVAAPEINVFTRKTWSRNGVVQSSDPQLLLTNGMHIVGILSRPRIEWNNTNHFYSNYIVANVRALSGAAVEKAPQNNSTILDSAFSYRFIPELDAYVPFDTNLIHAAYYGNDISFDPTLSDVGDLTNTQPPFPPNPGSWTAADRQVYWDQVRQNRRIIGAAYANTHDLRLTFRWPLSPNGDTGVGRHTFRLLTGGQLYKTNDPSVGVLPYPLYFLQPFTYARR